MTSAAVSLAAMTVIATMGAGIAALVARTFGRRTPARRHLAWHGALVGSCVASAVAFSPVHITLVRRVVAPNDASPPADARTRSAVSPGRPDTSLLLAAWLTGAIVVVLRGAGRQLRAESLRRRARVASDARWARHANDARARIGLTNPVPVRFSSEIDVPVIAGLFEPTLLLPTDASEWTEEEAAGVFAHELAHVLRGDLRGQVVGLFACALHWFNPVVWAVRHWANRDAELAADAIALRSGITSCAYASTLVSIAERAAWQPALNAGLEFVRRPLLAVRVHAALEAAPVPANLSAVVRRSAVLACGLLAAACGCIRVQTVTSSRFDLPDALATGTMSHGIASRGTTSNGTVSQRGQGATESAALPPLRKPLPAAVNRASQPARSAMATRRALDAVDLNTTLAPDTVQEPWTARAVRGLVDVLTDSSPQVRAAATRSLGELADPAARSALQRALGDSSKYVREEARRALSRLPLNAPVR